MISNQLRDALAAPRVREFVFGNEDFEALRKLVKELTGINLSDQKRELVYGRLARRLRALHLRTFAEYRDLLASDGGREIGELCNAITTNLTSFFRESHHFDYLREQVLQPLAAQRASRRRVRIWSAGCSTGDEAYSLAMTVIESFPDLRTWDVKILATDLDSDVLAKAQRGVYTADRVRSIGAQRLGRFFVEKRGKDGVFDGGSDFLHVGNCRCVCVIERQNERHYFPRIFLATFAAVFLVARAAALAF